MNKMTIASASMLAGLLLTTPAHATTRYGWGTITRIQTNENAKARGPARQPHFRVLIECGNQISCTEWKEQLVPIHGVGRHGPNVFVLDGKLSTPEEALKVGRMVNIMGDQYMAISSTVMGPEGLPGAKDEHNAILILGVGSVPGEFENRKGAGAWQPVKARSNVQLLIDIKDGQIRDAFAVAGVVCPPWFKRPWEPVDSSALKLVDGKLSGKATISIGANAPGLRRKDGTETIEKTVTFDPAKQPQVTLRNRPDEPIPSTGTFWARMPTSPRGGDSFVVMPFGADGSASGTFLFNKGIGMGTVTGSTLKLVDGKISGTITGTIGGKPAELSITGRTFANRMLLGDYTMTCGKWSSSERFRGGIVAAGAPPLVNLDRTILKAAKPAIEEWKAKRRAKRE